MSTKPTEIYKLYRERNEHVCNEVENNSCFVTFALLFCDLIWKKLKWWNGQIIEKNAKKLKFLALSLFFNLYIYVAKLLFNYVLSQRCFINRESLRSVGVIGMKLNLCFCQKVDICVLSNFKSLTYYVLIGHVHGTFKIIT